MTTSNTSVSTSAGDNMELVQELLAGGVYADHKGYWLMNGYDEFPGWDKLEVSDFFENLSRPGGHKKMWMNEDGTFKSGKTAYETESLMPLYAGIRHTTQIIVSTGFMMYSAMEVNMHLTLAYYARKLGCAASVRSVLALGGEAVKQDIQERSVALQLCAFVIYEADGLGSYSDKVWPFWGRLTGKACPANAEVLSQEEAEMAKENWNVSKDEARRQMFYEWWMLIDDKAHQSVPRSVVNKLYTAYKTVKRYQQMEAPTCAEEYRFNPESTSDVQAAMAGFFRRSAVGLGEAKAYDANEREQPASRFADMLEGELARMEVTRLITGYDGYTQFGAYFMKVLELNGRRCELVDEIISRQDDGEEAVSSYLAEGLKIKVSKRGRARV